MKRYAPVLIAVLAVLALVTAAGSFDAASGPSFDGGGSPDDVDEVNGSSGSGADDADGLGDSSGSGSGGDPATRADDRDDSDGISWLFSLLFVGAVVVGILLVVLLTDDERASPRNNDDREEESGPSGPPVDPTYGSPEDNAVVRAWRRLTDRVDDAGSSATPGETADAALDRGLPADAVGTLTRQFRAVRYGRARPDPDRERRAERLADRIDAESDTQDAESGRTRDRSGENGGEPT